MPFQVATRDCGNLVDTFLHVILTEGALPGIGRLENRRKRPRLADSQKTNAIRRTSGRCCGKGDATVYSLQVVGDCAHNPFGINHKPSIHALRGRSAWTSPNCWPSVSRTRLQTFICRPGCRP